MTETPQQAAERQVRETAAAAQRAEEIRLQAEADLQRHGQAMYGLGGLR